MTAPDYAAMTDAELNEAATLAMGRDYYLDDEKVVLCVIVKMGEDRNGSPKIEKRPLCTFDPANDLNHAAEFGAALLAAWPDQKPKMRIDIYVLNGVRCVVYGGGIFVAGDSPSEARARTVAVLQAWRVLKEDVDDRTKARQKRARNN